MRKAIADSHQNPMPTPIIPLPNNKALALLLGDTDGAATATSGLGVLAADAEAPVVTETTVGADLLQALEILTELGVDAVGQDLVVLAVDNVALPVEEPGGDLVLGGVLDDGDDALELFRSELTSTVCAYQLPVFFSMLLEVALYRLVRSTSAFLQTRLE